VEFSQKYKKERNEVFTSDDEEVGTTHSVVQLQTFSLSFM
jgi:hypothetical protein